MHRHIPAVGVIIPAYNASETIAETLENVRAQSYSNLEIVVVDDGSTDDTPQIVEAHAAADRRVRLIKVENGGVARARNIAIDAVDAALIAPLDADDLWHPRKVELQVRALAAAGEQAGIVYCWYVNIDEQGRIIRYGAPHKEKGDVLQRMCLGNLIGSGSSPLIRKSAIRAVGGYDPSLRDRDAQGCEDLSLYFAISERFEFAIVPQYLVGYRTTASSMSSNAERMLSSYEMVMGPAEVRHPAFADEFKRGRIHFGRWMLERAIRYGSADEIKRMYRLLFKQSASAAIMAMPRNLTLLRRRFVSRKPKLTFDDLVRMDEMASL